MAQPGASARPASEQNDNYCFGCPSSSQNGTHPHPALGLIQLAHDHSPQLQKAIEDTYPAEPLTLGRVWSSHGQDFFFALRAAGRPTLLIDDQPGPTMQSVPGSDLWYATAVIEHLGGVHSFRYGLNGKEFGGNPGNMPAYGELSYFMPGVKQGVLSAKQTITSRIYDGMRSDYWVYVPAGYESQTPSAVTVILDGGEVLSREGSSRTLDAIDNLVALKQIPHVICVFIDPGTIDSAPGNPTAAFIQDFASRTKRNIKDATRSVLYDTVSDRYPRFLRDELLPALASQYNIRAEGYAHAVIGFSSGGIGAFNAAWQFPQHFSRVVSGVGSFTSIQWKTSKETADGGQDFPDKVLQEPHRNIRVWLQDGSGDLEQPQYGSWPLNNIRLANALKLAQYDFHFTFDRSGHGPEAIEASLPQVLTWLWRDWDAAKTTQAYEMEVSEKAKPLFRVSVTNRGTE